MMATTDDATATANTQAPLSPDSPPVSADAAETAVEVSQADSAIETAVEASQADDTVEAPKKQREKKVDIEGMLLEGVVLAAEVLEVLEETARVSLAATPDPAEATLPLTEATAGDLSVGDKFDVFVDNLKGDGGVILVSRDKAEKLALWDHLHQASKGDTVIEGVIVAPTKGGLSVDIGTKAFLPSSQLELRPVRDVTPYVGQTHQFRVIKFNPKRGNIVVSRRPILEVEREGKKAELFANLHEGETVPGVVSGLTTFGAFVDIGGADGLLHTTDMSWGRVDRPGDLFAVGDEIMVKVLKVDRAKEKISLGHKQTMPDPWEGVSDKYPEGTKISGPIMNVTDYGAFVEIAPGVEGLVHVSELSWTKRIRDPRTVLKRGETIEAMVLSIDLKQQRIALGMRQLLENPWNALAKTHPEGTKVKGKVSSLTDFGAFVTLADVEGIDGLVHVSDISWTDTRKKPSECFAIGDEVEAVVLKVEVAEQRLGLGIKQLGEDPWTEIAKSHPRGTRFTGEVVRVVEFGAFIKIAEGIDGLCHISELSEDRVDRVSDVAKVGDKLEVTVIELDARKRKVGLSVKAGLNDVGDYKAYMKGEQEEDKPFGSMMGDALSKLQVQQPDAESSEDAE